LEAAVRNRETNLINEIERVKFLKSSSLEDKSNFTILLFQAKKASESAENEKKQIETKLNSVSNALKTGFSTYFQADRRI
jgi:hypothetical protein